MLQHLPQSKTLRSLLFAGAPHAQSKEAQPSCPEASRSPGPHPHKGQTNH